MKDKINLEIEIEKLSSDTENINNMIMEFVLKLREQNVNVLNYPKIETKLI